MIFSSSAGSFFDRIKSPFVKFFSGEKKLDEKMLDEIYNKLISYDFDSDLSLILCNSLKKEFFQSEISVEKAKNILKDKILNILKKRQSKIFSDENPMLNTVIYLVGSNGVGKTSLGIKICQNLKKYGEVGIIAADNFRYGAIEQLEIMSKEASVPVISFPEEKSSTVAFKGIQELQSKSYILVDTAGVSYTRLDLIKEIGKIVTSGEKADSNKNHFVLLVLDSTYGNTILQQVESFSKIIKIGGLVFTKLDSLTKPGIIASICNKFDFPVIFTTYGEDNNKLYYFNPEEFVSDII